MTNFVPEKTEVTQISIVFYKFLSMQNRSLISISDLSKEETLLLLRRAKEFEQNPNQRILEGKVVGSLFF